MPASLTTTLSASASVVDVAEVPPSMIFNSVAVASIAANFVKSACTNPDTPSNKFNSVAVDVNATSSFILGEVNVLFVSVCVLARPTKVSEALAGNVNVISELGLPGASVVSKLSPVEPSKTKLP